MQYYLATDEKGHRHLHTVATEAKAVDKNFVSIDIPTNKDGLKAAVQELLTEADNLRDQAKAIEIGTNVLMGDQPVELSEEAREALHDIGPVSEAIDFVTNKGANSYTEQSVKIEEAWAAMSLALQLHFASLALERAREELP